MGSAASSLARKEPQHVCECGHAEPWHRGRAGSVACAYPGCGCRRYVYSIAKSKTTPAYRPDLGQR